MPSFGNASMSRLNTCHRDLQTVLHEAIKIVDFSVVYGHRSPEEQKELWMKGRNARGEVVNSSEVVTFKDGFDKKSKHNYYPSKAVDIIPYPGGWQATEEFYYIAGIIQMIADRMLAEGKIQHKITWGGRWKNFVDLPHFQI